MKFNMVPRTTISISKDDFKVLRKALKKAGGSRLYQLETKIDAVSSLKEYAGVDSFELELSEDDLSGLIWVLNRKAAYCNQLPDPREKDLKNFLKSTMITNPISSDQPAGNSQDDEHLEILFEK